jgi:hypothetical protein
MNTNVENLTRNFYKIQVKLSGLFLDVLGGGLNNGVLVGQWQDSGLDNQKWLLVPIPDEDNTTYYIKAKHSGCSLDVLGGGLNNGVHVGQWVWNHKDNQKWILESLDSNYWKIKAKHSGLYLDVLGGGLNNGVSVGQWTKSGLDNQVWRLIPVESIDIPNVPANIPSSSFEPKMTSKKNARPSSGRRDWSRVDFVPFRRR